MYWPLRARNSFMQFARTCCVHAIPSCNLHGPVARTQFLHAICMDLLRTRNSFMQFAWTRCAHAIPSCNLHGPVACTQYLHAILHGPVVGLQWPIHKNFNTSQQIFLHIQPKSGKISDFISSPKFFLIFAGKLH